jgi:hypothetical protein
MEVHSQIVDLYLTGIMTITAGFAYLLCLLGMVAWLGGNLMFLSVVFRHSAGWFLGCLFVPFVDWIYFLFYANRTWKPVLIATAGCLLVGVGCWLAGLNFSW